MKRKKLFFVIIFNLFLADRVLSQVTFQKTFGVSNYGFGWSVHQTSDGGYILANYTSVLWAGSFSVSLIKTNYLGDTLWTKIYATASDGEGLAVQQTTDGGYIIAGSTYFGFGASDFFLIKTDSIGDTLWAKTYGGVDGEIAKSVQQTLDGGFVIGGRTQGFGAGGRDFYLVKTDSIGNLQWSKSYGGSAYDNGESAQQTKDGGYIFAGYTLSFGMGGWDFLLIKTDANGDTLWVKTYGGISNDYGYCVKQADDGGFIICGSTYLTQLSPLAASLIKTDSLGNLVWSKLVVSNNAVFGYSMQIRDSTKFIIGASGNGLGNNLMALVRPFPYSSIMQVYNTATPFLHGAAVDTTSDGGYIFAGTTDGFSGWEEAYLIKTDAGLSSGCFETFHLAGGNNDSTRVTNPAVQIMSGGVAGSLSVQTGSGSGVVTHCLSVVGVESFPFNNLINISPNPSFGNITITLPNNLQNGFIEIYSLLGEKLFKENIFNESTKEINVENISSGIYFVKVFDGKKSYCKKLIVEHD